MTELFNFIRHLKAVLEARRLKRAWWRAFVVALMSRTIAKGHQGDPWVDTLHGVISQDVFLDTKTGLVFGTSQHVAVEIKSARELKLRDALARIKGERVTAIWNQVKNTRHVRLHRSFMLLPFN